MEQLTLPGLEKVATIDEWIDILTRSGLPYKIASSPRDSVIYLTVDKEKIVGYNGFEMEIVFNDGFFKHIGLWE